MHLFIYFYFFFFFFFQAEDGIRDAQESRGLGDVYKRQPSDYWLSRRASMIEAVWGYDAGLPPRATPDTITKTNVTGVSQLEWNLGSPGPNAPAIISKVYEVRKAPGGGRAPRAFLLHHGHSLAPEPSGNWYDHYNMSGFLGDMADADVYILSMPLYGCNAIAGIRSSHSWFQQFERPGNSPIVNSSSTLRYFLEPVVLTANYAFSLGYESVSLTGKSGGGWTTTLVAAMDTRLHLTIPDAGSIPFEFNHTSWDYEQLPLRGELYARCDYTCMYILAGLEPGRLSVQVLHEDDPCCFRGRGRHPQILAYNDGVQGVLETRSGGAGWFSTGVVDWNVHEYSPRDRKLITEVWGAFVKNAPRSAYDALPCDILRAPHLHCSV
eukprot:TRINITY_DN61697_c0_g1_i2.p1 TRINITY_DN61697_c0_g1~~TRINITY_DN61697_c0_g1_i2.p1  ORF type:complete len:380 (-),score=71.73 TRINITY_DN61697_c0_g1_i2:218-1357(-)